MIPLIFDAFCLLQCLFLVLWVLACFIFFISLNYAAPQNQLSICHGDGSSAGARGRAGTVTANVTPGGLEALPDLGNSLCFSPSTFPAGVRGRIFLCARRAKGH